MWKKIKPYVISVLFALAVGGLAAWLTMDSMDIYGSITQPALAPPAWLFPVVWTVLYVLMGISSTIVYTDKNASPKEKASAIKVYALQLIVNFFWSLIFFNLRNYLFAFIWLILLWVLILIMIVKFYKIRPVAGLLQIPYLLWVTFAGYLNLMIYLLNR
ncbi:MAG: tryptophan-rich sensory protein [Clostridia bacterium]|nr:tryptophan-rich sensory protein [Clostridia bacterium]